jgi:hypothetical protein
MELSELTTSPPPAESWDPLEGDLPTEVLSATIKREIKNILKSYTGWFDPLAELTQNALDAIDARLKTIGDKFDPVIAIEIDLRANRIAVIDNGIGFDDARFRSFLAPNVSYKKSDNRGNKGVGATYLAYGFNSLTIATKSPEFKYAGRIKNGREWVEDDSGTVTRPKIVADNPILPASYDDIDRGSAFVLTLSGQHVRPRRLDWIGAVNAEQWHHILRLKTPIGGIYPDAVPNLVCKLTVIDGSVTEKAIPSCEYLFPQNVISASVKLDDIRNEQRDLLQKGKDASRLPDRFYKLNGLYNIWRAREFLPGGEFGGKLSKGEEELVQKFNVLVHGYFAYSTEVWDFFNDEVLKIRKGERILRGGLQLGTNHMPQGEVKVIPLKRNIGYQNVSHVLVHFEGADPDLGRKGFQPELQELSEQLSVLVTNAFLGWRTHLKKETGAPPDIVSKRSIHDWIVEQENHEKTEPLVINREDFFLPVKAPSITSRPLNEQDVVALFNQLLAGGVIRGIRLMAASTHQQYDGICRMVLTPPVENHIFDEANNPLGIPKDVMSRPFTSDPRILEYKYSFDGLIEEFEKEVKTENEVGLLVAWTMGEHWKARYEVTSLLDLTNVHHRYFHGGTHIIKRSATGDTAFPAIILSELIDFINDVDGLQEWQKRQYRE